MKTRTITLFGTTVAILMLTTRLDHPALASPLSIEVSAGFHGYYRVGNWLPVRVSVENHGTHLDAHIAIQMGTRQFVQHVSLPSPSKKRFEFYVLPPVAQEVLSLFLTAAGKTIATARARLNRLSEKASLIVVVTHHRSNYDFLQRPARSRSKRHVVYPGPADLPESWKGYATVEAVILDTPEIDTLHPFQRQALIRWLQLGGKLLFVERTPRSRTSALYRQLVALTASGTTTSHAATTVGLGSLLYTAVPPDATGILVASGARIGWQTWLDAQTQWPPIPLAVLDRQILRRINTTPRGQTHLVQYLGGFLGLYVVVVVGLCGCILSRYVNPWWGYATSGGMILAFALLTPFLGLVVHRRAVVVRESTLVHVFPRSSNLYVTTSAMLLTPRKQRYHFQAAQATYVQTEVTMPLRYEFTDRRLPANIYFSMPMWTNRRFVLERFTKNAWFLSKPDGPSATIVNRSPSKLCHCYWLGSHGTFRLPDVPAGQTVSITPSSSATVEPFQLRGLPTLLSRVLSGYRNAISLTGSPDSVVCSFSGIVPSLTSPTHKVQHEGTTVLIVHLERQTRS